MSTHTSVTHLQVTFMHFSFHNCWMLFNAQNSLGWIGTFSFIFIQPQPQEVDQNLQSSSSEHREPTGAGTTWIHLHTPSTHIPIDTLEQLRQSELIMHISFPTSEKLLKERKNNKIKPTNTGSKTLMKRSWIYEYLKIN